VLDAFIDKPLPKSSGPLREILLSAACQLLFLNTPAHAAIDLAVRQAKQDRNARHFDRLANAVLRRVASEGPALVKEQNGPRLNTPAWLWERWVKIYGEGTSQRIAQANMAGAALDLTVKQDPAAWARRLNGIALDTGSVRLSSPGRIEGLEGYDEGGWWVQDAAAALPARLLGAIADKHVADLCAAPGGKTAVLAAAGARVTACDIDAKRLEPLLGTLERMQLSGSVEVVALDVTSDDQGLVATDFDAALVDAPCSNTGVLGQRPGARWRFGPDTQASLRELQSELIARAARRVRPGGRLVYSTCSTEPDENGQRVRAFIAEHPEWQLEQEHEALPASFTAPFSEVSGEGDASSGPVDGGYAARLRRSRQ